jgi:hypothetical protein
MALVVKTYGPPGTGKTTRLIERVEEERKRGVLLERMAYLSFSVAAKDVIKERLRSTERELRWFRTIHGACGEGPRHQRFDRELDPLSPVPRPDRHEDHP